MNWETDIVALSAVAGFSGALVARHKNAPMPLLASLGYFSLMGVLQAFTHTIADQCALSANQIATLLAYLHVCFQPFFINALALHCTNQRIAKKIDIYVYELCFTFMTIMLIQVYPFNWAGRCEPGSLMCGETLCTINDGSLLSWMLPITKFADTLPWYMVSAIVLPLLYGAWRFMLVYACACLLPAWLMTHSMNEWPGVSSLLMIPFLLVWIYKPWLRTRTLAMEN